MYPNPRSEGKIGRLVIPNRVAMTAMWVDLAAPDGGVTDDIVAFCEARARGGVGLTITEVARDEGDRAVDRVASAGARKETGFQGRQS